MIDRVETSADRVRNKTSQNGVIQPLLTGKMVVKGSLFFLQERFRLCDRDPCHAEVTLFLFVIYD